MTNTKTKARRKMPEARVHPAAVGVDQQRDSPHGIERGRGPSDRMRLPHERDESPLPGVDRAREPAGSTERVEQAARDVARGLLDTERRGIPNDLPPPRRRAPDGEQS